MSEQPPADPSGPPPWQPPPPPHGQQPPGYPVPVAPAATGKSTAALLLGIFGVVLCPLILSVPAIFVGHAAKREIDASQGQLGGRSQALAGFILGIVGTVIGLIAILIVLVVFAFGNVVQDSFEDTCASFDENSVELTNC